MKQKAQADKILLKRLQRLLRDHKRGREIRVSAPRRTTAVRVVVPKPCALWTSNIQEGKSKKGIGKSEDEKTSSLYLPQPIAVEANGNEQEDAKSR